MFDLQSVMATSFENVRVVYAVISWVNQSLVIHHLFDYVLFLLIDASWLLPTFLSAISRLYVEIGEACGHIFWQTTINRLP